MRRAYQTLEDRDIHKVETDGPFKCTKENAWLGHGYYFWDSFIENAHWWGKEVNNFKNGYIICESRYLLAENNCFNLVDNPIHLREFNQAKSLLIEKGLYVHNSTTVARIITYLRETLKIFKYEAIRAYGVNSINPGSTYSNRTKFKFSSFKDSFQYLDSLPAIQICFCSKTSLSLTGFVIVYPIEYIEDYVV